MNQSEGNTSREIKIGQSIIDPSIIERALIDYPLVIECRVLAKSCTDKGKQLVAYIVSTEAFDSDKVHDFLRSQLPTSRLPASYIAVTHMPLTDKGAVDDKALSSLVLINDELINEWHHELSDIEELSEYIVVAQDKNYQCDPLHIAHLCPKWHSSSSDEELEDIDYEEGEVSEVLALSDGGPLILDETLPQTIPESLFQAQKHPGSGIVYIQHDGSEVFQSYADLLIQAQKFATGLSQNGLKPRDVVILQIPQLDEFFAAFWGCLLSGITPLTVALAPSYSSKNGVLEKLYNAWLTLQEPTIITSEAMLSDMQDYQSVYNIDTLKTLSTKQLNDHPPAQNLYQSQPDEIAFFQLSSGSTGVSKCIPEVHSAVLKHFQASTLVNGYHSQHISLNWLPMDHVVPLLMYHVRDVFLGIRQIQVIPAMILNEPTLWLDYLEKYQVTHTWSPNFGYKRVCESLQQQPHKRWDLSSVEVFCNAGEQVTLPVIKDFLHFTEPFNVKTENMQPAYGMAEASTVICYCTGFDYKKHVHFIEKVSLSGNLKKVEEEAPDTVSFIGQGAPNPGLKIRIVDNDDNIMPEKKIGRVQLTSETVMPGYLYNDKANEEAFAKDGWYNTGDLGFLLDGELTITGREKDVIVVYGANFYCADIEAVVNDIHGVVPTFVAATGVSSDTGTEQLAIFFVPKRAELSQNIELLETIKTQVTLLMGINPSYVIPLSVEEFPKTTSGKIQRAKLKNDLMNGHYDEIRYKIDCYLRNDNTLPNWFFKTHWRPHQAELVQAEFPQGPYLVFMDDKGLGKYLVKELRDHYHCICVEPGETYEHIDRYHYRIEPNNCEHYHLLFSSLHSSHFNITQVLHLWNYKTCNDINSLQELEDTQKWVMCNFLLLIQNLIKNHDYEQVINCWMISSEIQVINDEDKAFFGRSSLLGLVKTLPKEIPWLQCRHVDIPVDDINKNGPCLLNELKTLCGHQEIAYRNNQRYINRLTRVEFERPKEKKIPFKAKGLYLITGGLGRIGLSIAQMLLEQYQARLIIIDDYPLPDKAQWSEMVAQNDPLTHQIKCMEFLQQFEGECRYYHVDVCDQSQLHQIVAESEQFWQDELDGIIHLAGVPQYKLLKDETRDSLANVLKPKVMGSWVLHQILKDKAMSKADNKIFIHFSSVSSFFGAAKSGADAAANRFINSFSEYQNQTSLINSMCYAWTWWHDNDLVKTPGYSPVQREALSPDSGYHEMSHKQGIYSLMIALQHQHSFLLIGLNGAKRPIRHHIEFTAHNSQEVTAYYVCDTEEEDNSNLTRRALDIYDDANEAVAIKTVNDCFNTPSSCVPVRLNKMPLNTHGDIDTQKLIASQSFDSTNTELFVLPGTDTEQQLAWIWQDILEIGQPSIHDNFFKLGGNSLMATVFTSRVRDVFHYDLSIQAIFKAPTIAEIAQLLDGEEQEKEDPIPRLTRDADFMPRLSIGQERLWFLYQLAPENPQYNIPASMTIRGELDIIALIKSFNELIQRHESLRTRFTYRGNQAVQDIVDDLQLSITITDITGALVEQHRKIHQLSQEETLTPFDITRLPLLRVKLFRLADDHFVMLTVFHHIIIDGWGLGVFFHELTSLYRAHISEMSVPLSPIKTQYADFAEWQRDWLSGKRLQKQMDYWLRQLADLPTLNLIPDRPRTKATRSQGARHTLLIDRALTDKLTQLGQQQETSLYMTLLSAFMVLCARYSGQDDIPIATAIASRNRSELEPLVGYFTNTLVMRGDLSGNPDFLTVLQRIKDTSLEAWEHQDVPFGYLVDELQPQREIGQNPLSQIVFVMQNNPSPMSDIPGIDFSPWVLESGLVKMDMEVNVYEIPEGLRIETEFNRDLYDLSTLERMFAHYQLILKAISIQPQQVVNTIALLSKEEQQRLFSSDISTDKKFPLSSQCIHGVVETLAQNHPNSTAVFFEQQTLNYQQLNQKANQLARYLQQKGVQKESLVGICIERSQEMIIALLAIFKAGGAYVPLDPAYPENRLQFILEDTQLSVLLTQASLQEKLPENSARMVCIDSEWPEIETQDNNNLNLDIKGHHLAYIIYTSGSTGKPKGVLIEHKGLNNLIYAQSLIFELNSSDKVLQFSSLNFDASIFEITMALSSGAALVMVNQRALMFGAPLLRLLEQEAISIATIPPSVLVTLPVEDTEFLPHLKKLVVAGEAPNPEVIAKWSKKRSIYNAYGPTETTVWATTYLYNNETATPPIGKAIANSQVYLLDKAKQPVPIGIPGEIHIGGIGVARGYLNRPELTDERFIPDPFSSETDARMYCSGDLARYLPDGNIEYIGRIDQQIKIRGFRVEPGEIENRLREHNDVKDAFIHINKTDPQNVFLEAFVTQTKPDIEQIATFSSNLKAYLKDQLPPHMVPSTINVIEKIPLTPNGKLDYTKLAALKVKQMEAKVSPEVAKIIPASEEHGDYAEIEAIIIQVIKEKLHVDEVGVNSHFFEELGGTSLGMVHIHKVLEKQLSEEISLIDLFEYPTVAQLSQFLSKGSASTEQAQLLKEKMPERVSKQQTQSIAVIGMSGRFPGANSVDEFWTKLKDGQELIKKFSKEELLVSGIDKETLNNPKYVRRKGALDGVEDFDAAFFNFTPKEAKITDPQQRLFLESTWEAFEHAGYDPYNYPGTVGVMAGLGSSNTYYQKNLQYSDFGKDVIGDYQLNLSNSADFLCTRVAYKLNLKGSATTIQSACSTSLVPSVMGYQALINYQADLIVAGGSAISLPAKNGYQYEEGMILSPDGHCRTFDASAQGTVIGNATGVVLLKRLEDAIRDGDTIYATIRGAAFNNDGDQKVGFTAAGLDGQTRVITEALQTANIPPDSISYVEAHGTATPLGDPIEIRALTKAWYAHAEAKNKDKKKGYCAIGSVKTNTGHCDAAAGITGLIKTVCSLHHKQLPPSLHYRSANPQIDFANSPFYVNTKLNDWKKNGPPRRAGISSFGMGGTNAHVILEEAPDREASSKGRDWLLLSVSAKTPTALETMMPNLIEHIKNHPEQNPMDIAYTAHVGRHSFKYRQVLVCANNPEAIATLSTDDQPNTNQGETLSEKTPEVTFLFPGQGAQYLNMGQDLYQSEAIFRHHIDQCAELLQAHLSEDIRDILYPETTEDHPSHSERLNQTDMAQPILFAIEYALAQLLISWGIKPTMLAGHSLGEYTAACVAGAISLDDCLKIVSMRARLMQSMLPGSMIAVPLSEDEVKHYLTPQLDLATVNGPRRCVISGPDDEIQVLHDQLKSEGIEARILHTSHAYHSAMMEPMLSEFYEALEDFEFQTPVLPIISSTNGQPIQTLDKAYWTSQIRETVRFSDVLSQIYQHSDHIILEVGPGNTLSSFARVHNDKPSNTQIFNTMRHPKENLNDSAYVLSTLGKLWIAGVTPDWSAFYQSEKRYRVAIPTYPFEKKRHWVDAPLNKKPLKTNAPLTKSPDIKDWFYVPSWKQTELVNNISTNRKDKVWLVFMDSYGIAEHIAAILIKQQASVMKIYRGAKFQATDTHYILNPAHENDYQHLAEALKQDEMVIDSIIHCWMLDETSSDRTALSYQQAGLYSLLFLVQSMDKYERYKQLDLMVLTNDLFNVSRNDKIEPLKATILGAIKVIPQEYPNIRCLTNDIVLTEWQSDNANLLTDYLLYEFEQNAGMIAYRDKQRWVSRIEPVQITAQQQSFLLKPKGVYLITGGLGGVGLAIANYLAKTVQARIVLLSRSSLPEKEHWHTWLNEHNYEDKTSQLLIQLQKIEALGGEVLTLSADVTDLAQMTTGLNQIHSQFGHVNGVIHAAGVPGIELIRDINSESIEQNMSAKLQGTLVLNQIFDNEKLDFFILCSSLSTTLGGLGFSSYCAANAFLDAYALSKATQSNYLITSIDWEGWSEVGMAVDNNMAVSKGNELGLLTTEGIEVFSRLLNQKMPQVIISTADLHLRQQLSSRKKIAQASQTENEPSHTTSQTNYSPPMSLTEKKIEQVWSNSLGIKHIGVEDDFFELGGDSLTAVQLIPQLRKVFDVDLSPHSLIQAPTIKLLSQIIEKESNKTSDSAISPLLVKLKSGQADRPPLFLIHPVGGSVYIYRDLANALNTQQSIYGIQARGWDDQDTPLESINDMASLYTNIIRQVQPEGPYYMGGSSLGGVIAYEMAQQLKSAQQDIALLFMVDTPGTGHMPKDIFKTDLDILLYLLNIGAENNELSEQLKILEGDKQLEYVINQQNKSGHQLFPNIDELRRFLSLFKVNARAMQNYQSKPYQGNILFFLAQKKDDYNAKNPQDAWSDKALEGFEVIKVSGNHISMNHKPNVLKIAKQLDEILNM